MKTRRWLLVILWALVIFFLSHHPGADFESSTKEFLLRKTAHFIEYAVLFFLLFRAVSAHKLGLRKAVFLSAAIALFYAVSDEYHQGFVSARDGNIRDVLIDSLGIFSAAWMGLRGMLRHLI